MKFTRVVRPILAALFCACALPAYAVPVTYSFSGTADSTSWGNGTDQPFGGEYPFGQVATGSFTFDLDYSSVAFASERRLFVRPTSSEFGSFALAMPTFSGIGSFGSAGADCSDTFSSFVIADDDPNAAMPYTPAPADLFRLQLGCNQQIAPGVTVMRSLWFELVDWDAGSDLLTGLDAAQALDLALASLARLTIGYTLIDSNCVTCLYGIRENWNVGFTVDSLTGSVHVPEPATPMLLVLGLAGCLAGRRRGNA